MNFGSYTVTATYAGDVNHTGSSDSATITIGQAASTTTATGASFTYDGTTHTGGSAVVSGAGVVTGSAVLSYTGDQVNFGSYTVTATFAGDLNHTGSSDSATISIAKASSTTKGTGDAFTYDGTTHTGGSAVVSGVGVITGNAVLSYSGDQVDAGSYTVIATYAGDANHTGSTNSATITIGQASSTTTATGDAFTYDGTTHTGGSAVVSGAGVVTGNAVLSYSGDQVDAGSYTVTATYAGDANHTSSSGARPPSASPRLLVHDDGHWRMPSPYDGSTGTPAASAVVSGAGVVTGSAVLRSYSGETRSTPAFVYGDGDLRWRREPHRQFRTRRPSASPRPRPRRRATGHAAFTYDGTTHTGGSAVVSGAGVVTGAAVLSYTGDQVNAGSYTVTATYAGDLNHTGSSDSATISIAKASSTTKATGDAFTYDGGIHTGGSAVVIGTGVIAGSACALLLGRPGQRRFVYCDRDIPRRREPHWQLRLGHHQHRQGRCDDHSHPVQRHLRRQRALRHG